VKAAPTVLTTEFKERAVLRLESGASRRWGAVPRENQGPPLLEPGPIQSADLGQRAAKLVAIESIEQRRLNSFIGSDRFHCWRPSMPLLGYPGDMSVITSPSGGASVRLSR
jgi:hypothetical protein